MDTPAVNNRSFCELWSSLFNGLSSWLSNEHCAFKRLTGFIMRSFYYLIYPEIAAWCLQCDCDPFLHAAALLYIAGWHLQSSKTKLQIALGLWFSSILTYLERQNLRYIIYHTVNRSCVCAFCILAILPSCGAVVVAGERSCCDPTIVNYLTNDDCVYNVYIPQSTCRMWNSTITW